MLSSSREPQGHSSLTSLFLPLITISHYSLECKERESRAKQARKCAIARRQYRIEEKETAVYIRAGWTVPRGSGGSGWTAVLNQVSGSPGDLSLPLSPFYGRATRTFEFFTRNGFPGSDSPLETVCFEWALFPRSGGIEKAFRKDVYTWKFYF